MKNKIIGLTGKIGSGKSFVSNVIVKKFKAIHISCDEIAKEIIKNKEFKNSFFLDDDIFENENKMYMVKKFFHPYVWKKIRKIANDLILKNEYDYIIIETALPNEDFFDICDITLLISNSYEDKVKNLVINRKYDEIKIKKILKSQVEYEIFYNKCNFILKNNKSLEEFEKDIISFIIKNG